MCSGSEARSYLRLIDSCITQLKGQGPSRTCHESKGEEVMGSVERGAVKHDPPTTPSLAFKTVSTKESEVHRKILAEVPLVCLLSALQARPTQKP